MWGVEVVKLLGGDPVLQHVAAAHLVDLVPVQERALDLEPGHIADATGGDVPLAGDLRGVPTSEYRVEDRLHGDLVWLRQWTRRCWVGWVGGEHGGDGVVAFDDELVEVGGFGGVEGWSRQAVRKVLISLTAHGARAVWAAAALVRASRGILVYWATSLRTTARVSAARSRPKASCTERTPSPEPVGPPRRRPAVSIQPTRSSMSSSVRSRSRRWPSRSRTGRTASVAPHRRSCRRWLSRHRWWLILGRVRCWVGCRATPRLRSVPVGRVQ